MSLTVDEFKNALPAKMRKSINPVVIQEINTKLADPDMYEHYRENLLGYAHVMQDGKFKVDSYVNAVKYISQKLMGKTNAQAFELVFPTKVKDWVARNLEQKDMASYITAYNKSKLVTLLYEQTMTPFWIMNQDLYQKAINTQAVLMTDAKSEKVRSDAANSLLTHLKPPETQKVELDIGVKENSAIQMLRETTQALVARQREMIVSGTMDAQEIAHQPIVIEQVEDE